MILEKLHVDEPDVHDVDVDVHEPDESSKGIPCEM